MSTNSGIAFNGFPFLGTSLSSFSFPPTAPPSSSSGQARAQGTNLDLALPCRRGSHPTLVCIISLGPSLVQTKYDGERESLSLSLCMHSMQGHNRKSRSPLGKFDVVLEKNEDGGEGHVVAVDHGVGMEANDDEFPITITR